MATALVGGALLSAFLQVAFDRLASPQVLDFFRGRKLDEDLLSKLNIKLLSIDALADDAEEKQFRDPRVKAWLAAVRDVVFGAEDLLDEIDYELSKSQMEAESRSQTFSYKVSNLFNDTFSSFNRKFDSGMKQVLDKLEYLASQKGDLGLKDISHSCVGSGSKVSHKLPSTSLVVESVIYGRDDDKEIIFNWLRSKTDKISQLSILSIVGMGGLGKTTLAQHIYNDPRMKEINFDIKVWVCVSDEFEVLNVTRVILEKIAKSKYDGDLDMLHGRLKEELSGKRFLLVLDDVWNEDQEKWEVVQTPLNYGAQGSRILVTTRSEKVASTMHSNKVHHLKQLQEDQCWKIFAKHAFQNDHPHLNTELKEIGTKIVEKCKGLPLALKTIGSLLRTKSFVSEWENVLLSMIWNLSKEDNKIIPALFLSYHHLPSHLKRCFAYCALFPKDYQFDKNNLIQLWMAENFLQCPQQSKNPEEVGEQYFSDLLSRSFFQQANGTFFVMHDLLNDLAKYICGDICFRLGVDKAKSMPKISRHLSLELNDDSVFDGFESSYDAKRLHTFIPIRREMEFTTWECQIPIHELLSKFKSLRVLSFSGCSNLKELPDSVGELKQLRSLDLSSTSITKLPDSTCSLYNLKILKLNDCLDLKEFPLNFHKLVNLRHLELPATVGKTPMHLGRLKNLQVLTVFNVGKSSEFSIEQIGELDLHGKLSIMGLQNVINPSDALKADLKNKTHLEKLTLEWDENHIPDDPGKEKEVLENLQPSKHLRDLSIYNYGGTQLPSWLSTVNVVSIWLGFCEYCLILPPFGVLPFLKKLTIWRFEAIVSIGEEFYGSSSSSFKFLEFLLFSYMKEWEEWECQTATFPSLQCLRISECPKLKELPEQLLQEKNVEICACARLNISGHNMEATSLEIGHFVSDTSLSIHNCPKMNIPVRCYYNFLTTLVISSSAYLTTFPLDSFQNLRNLYLLLCCNLQIISQEQTHNHLQVLEISHCPNVNIFMNPVTLEIHGNCVSLTNISLDFFPKLCSLKLKLCRNLQMISQEHTHNNLKVMHISDCSQFESFPIEGLSAPFLETIILENLKSLKLLPKDMHILLPSLTHLKIRDCPQVEMLSDRGLPSNIKSMSLSSLKLIASLKGALTINTSLETLSIENIDVESFPDEGDGERSFVFLSLIDLLNHVELGNKGIEHEGLNKLLKGPRQVWQYSCWA
ncbi:hypothetical protein Fmac_016319 [Flemingia macrophylla]|uniref:Disease resistance RPP13-like protein 1 n=1 Tax=Flemingia macrophylla TaxID=520843 RepID=A0ABD1MH33_9FABA